MERTFDPTERIHVEDAVRRTPELRGPGWKNVDEVLPHADGPA